MSEDDPEVLRQRIRELTAELALANRELDRLRELESENDELRHRVDALSNELLSLSPPRVPKFSFPVGVSHRPSGAVSGQPSSSAASSKKGAFGASQISLAVILVAVVLAWIPFILSWLDTPTDDVERATERGLVGPPPSSSPAVREVTPEVVDDTAPPDAGAPEPEPPTE